MAQIVADRVKEASTSTGSGDFTLAGAMTGFAAFSSVCATNDTCYYAIQGVDGTGLPTGEWEVGYGTYSAANTLTRTTVLSSSNAGAAVNFAAGTKQVWIDAPAKTLAANGHCPAMRENAQTISADYTLGANRNAVSAGPITINTGVTVTVSSGSVWTIV